MQSMVKSEGKSCGYLWHQLGGHGEDAIGMEVDVGNFDADPFCGITMPAEAGGNDGRGDIRDIESFEGDTLSDDGPPIV